MVILGSLSSSLRVLTCSLDRHIALYDMNTSRICLKVLFPSPLESVVSNHTLDYFFAGSSEGTIFILDVSISAVSASAAHALLVKRGQIISGKNEQPTAISSLSGHQRAVTGLDFSLDNRTLVSISEDGSLRLWDSLSRQCVKELYPLGKNPLTNLKVKDPFSKFEVLDDRRLQYVRSSSRSMVAGRPSCQ